MIIKNLKKILFIAALNAVLLSIGNYINGSQGIAIAFIMALMFNNIILQKGIV